MEWSVIQTKEKQERGGEIEENVDREIINTGDGNQLINETRKEGPKIKTIQGVLFGGKF